MNINAIYTSFFLGLLATTSPCVLPLFPGFLAYLSGQQGTAKGRSWLGLFVLAGVLSMMLALGGVIALLSVSVGAALSYVIPTADMIILLFGFLLILNINPFKSLPRIQVPILSNPLVNAFLYGLLYGPIALPCSGPLVVGIFALSLNAVDFFSKMTLFLWFGLGFGMPLLIISMLAGSAQRWITRLFARHGRLINMIGGVLLIGAGLYDLYSNWDLIATRLPFLR